MVKFMKNRRENPVYKFKNREWKNMRESRECDAAHILAQEHLYFACNCVSNIYRCESIGNTVPYAHICEYNNPALAYLHTCTKHSCAYAHTHGQPTVT